MHLIFEKIILIHLYFFMFYINEKPLFLDNISNTCNLTQFFFIQLISCISIYIIV